MSQTDDYTLRVNGSQAQAELNKTREASMNLGGGLIHVEKGLDALSGRAGTEAKKALGSLQFAMGGVSGEAAALVDGVGDVIGALGNPWSVAFIGAGAAVTLLAHEWQEMAKDAQQAADDAVKAARSIADGILAGNEALRVKLQQQQSGAASEAEAKVQLLAAQVQGLRYQIAEFEKQGGGQGFLSSFTDSGKRLSIAKEELANLTAELERATAALNDAKNLQRGIEGSAPKPPGTTAPNGTPRATASTAANDDDPEIQNLIFLADMRRKALAEGAKRAATEAAERARALAAQQVDDARALEAAQKAEEALTEVTRKAAEARAEIVRREHEATLSSYRGYASEATTIVVGASQQLIEAAITGQEHAAEAFAASVMANAGNAMIGHGINAFSGGVAEAALTGGAAGGPAIATGLGLIAGGVALGGSAAGINHIVGGGTIGSPLADKGRTERGIHEGSSKSRLRDGKADGRPMQGATIINNYGVAGPLADDQARSLERVQQRLMRRNGFRGAR